MKKLKNIVMSALVFVLLFGLTVSAAVAKPESGTLKNQKYEYPITPQKTPDIWKSFGTHQQMVDACEIPESTLETMPTKSLLLSCLDYPLLGDAFCCNSVSSGFEIVMKNSNALKSLFLRADFSEELALLFETTTAAELESESSESGFTMQFLALMTEYAVDNDLLSAYDKNRIMCSLENFTKDLQDEGFSLMIKNAVK